MAIVGIVAALTVPTLYHKYQMAVNKARLKEAQSILAHGISNYKNKYGITNMANFLSTGDENSRNNATSESGILGSVHEKGRAENAILYLVLSESYKDLEYCRNTLSEAKAKELGIKLASNITCNELYKIQYYQESGAPMSVAGKVGDGDVDKLIFKNFSFGTEWLYQLNREIYVDVNGPFKGPNRHGYDAFGFRVTADGNLIPCGAQGYSCNYNSTTYKALHDPNYWKGK